MLSHRAIALQGVGYSPRLVALQGFSGLEQTWTGAAQSIPLWRRRFPWLEVELDIPHDDEEEIVEIVLLLVTSGILGRRVH